VVPRQVAGAKCRKIFFTWGRRREFARGRQVTAFRDEKRHFQPGRGRVLTKGIGNPIPTAQMAFPASLASGIGSEALNGRIPRLLGAACKFSKGGDHRRSASQSRSAPQLLEAFHDRKEELCGTNRSIWLAATKMRDPRKRSTMEITKGPRAQNAPISISA